MKLKLHPSSAHRWGPGGCPASVGMEAQYPDTGDSQKKREGDAAGWYVVQCLLDPTTGPKVPPAVGTLAPGGVPVTQEMVDCADDIVRDIGDTLKARQSGTLRIEEPVSAVETVHPENDGRPDFYLLDVTGRRLHIWDYKYGHRYVDAFMNWQCVDYAAMILESNGIPVSEWGGFMITVTIAQPRNFHPDGPLREWHFNGAQLAEYVARLKVAAGMAMAERPQMQTGGHCRDCTARHACPALERISMRLVDMAYEGQPIDLPPAALGLELRIIRDAIKRLGARAEGLEAHALSLAKGGTSIPHWRAEYSKGRERWRDEVSTDEVVMLGEIYGVDLKKPQAVITPTQARKAGVDPEAVKGFAHAPTGAMTLVPFDDADVAKRFG